MNLEVIIAVGHTDSQGGDAYNQKLSVKRAEAVKTYVVEKGIEPNRVYTEGKGKTQPVAGQQDRRRPRQEPSRGNRSRRYPHRDAISLRAIIKSPAPQGFFFAGRSTIAPASISETIGMNVDQAELEKFNSLASRWWDPTSEFKPLHDINPLRLGWIDGIATLNGKRVADIGCGGGILAESMARTGARVTGIDMADKPLKVAQLHSLETGIEVDYRKSTAEELAAAEGASFDVVTCMEMLEHVPDPAGIVRAAAALAKPGGYLFFSTINRNPKSYLFAVIGAEYLLRMLPTRHARLRQVHQAG